MDLREMVTTENGSAGNELESAQALEVGVLSTEPGTVCSTCELLMQTQKCFPSQTRR